MYHFLVRPTTAGKYDDLFLWRRNFLKKWSVFESWGKNDSSKKKATTLETFWFWKNLKRRQQKRRKQKSKRRQRYDSPPTIYITKKILNDEAFTGASRNEIIEGESCAIHLVENSRSSIGAGESSKVLVQHKHFVLLWAPSHRGKICHCFSDVLNRNFGELKQSKHGNEA